MGDSMKGRRIRRIRGEILAAMKMLYPGAIQAEHLLRSLLAIFPQPGVGSSPQGPGLPGGEALPGPRAARGGAGVADAVAQGVLPADSRRGRGGGSVRTGPGGGGVTMEQNGGAYKNRRGSSPRRGCRG